MLLRVAPSTPRIVGVSHGATVFAGAFVYFDIHESPSQSRSNTSAYVLSTFVFAKNVHAPAAHVDSFNDVFGEK